MQDFRLFLSTFLGHISLSIWAGNNAETHIEFLTPSYEIPQSSVLQYELCSPSLRTYSHPYSMALIRYAFGSFDFSIDNYENIILDRFM